MRAVLRHELHPVAAGEKPGAVIEKRVLSDLFGRPPAELLFYQGAAPALRLNPLDLPTLIGSERVGREDRLFLEALEGSPPGFSSVLKELGLGIAALELSSHAWFQGLTRGERKQFGPLEFFGPGPFRRGFRSHYPRYLAVLICRRQSPGTRSRLARIGWVLAALERLVRRDPACLCHLDLSGKNLIRSGERLSLIDWGQVSLGRPGFDVATALAQLARRRADKSYARGRRALLRPYARRLKAEAPELLPASRRGRAFYFGCALLFHMAHRPPLPNAPWLLDCIEAELARAGAFDRTRQA